MVTLDHGRKRHFEPDLNPGGSLDLRDHIDDLRKAYMDRLSLFAAGRAAGQELAASAERVSEAERRCQAHSPGRRPQPSHWWG